MTARRALSGWPMVIGWLAMLIFALHACTHMVAAGDTWVAMACGRHFVNQGVDTVEPFSANSHKPGPTPEEIRTWPDWARWIADKVGLKTVKALHPTGWINQNWLTHVIFYSLVPKSSYADGVSFPSNALVYWKFTIYILSVICVYYTGRLLGVNPALCAVFACFALFAGRSYVDIRPAGFSNFLVAVFLLVLALATYRNVLYIWLIVPLTVFWCNAHGGYIYVFIMLIPFFVLHSLVALPRKWTISVGSILLWAGLYTFAYKFRVGLHGMILEFLSKHSLAPVPPYAGRLFYLIAILIIVSLVITARKRSKDVTSYAFHIATTSVVVPALLIAMSMAKIPSGLTEPGREAVNKYIHSNFLEFLTVFIVLTTLIVVTAFLKERLVSVRLRGIYHTIAAGFVTFIAVVVFNPFHLTNLTHTFVISVSKHAERWRKIHEWWGAFDWTNKVGTGFPFLVLFILGIGLFGLWMFSRLLLPRLLKAPRNELEAQKKSFTILSKIFGVATWILVCWLTFVSFSLLGLDAGSFFFCALFAGILLLSVYKNALFIYLVVPLTLLAVWTGSSHAGYGGRYIYPFVVLPAYVILHIVASSVSKTVKDEREPLHISFVASAAVVSLFLMAAIFNPFDSEAMWHVRRFFPAQRLWRPVYERNVSVSYAGLFDMLYAVNIAAIFVWFGMPQLRKIINDALGETGEQPPDETYQLPKIDLAMMTIAALTMYMAVRSRRFIPIAAIAAGPIAAMLIEQIIRAYSASRNFHARNRLVVSAMPRSLQSFFTVAGAVVVFFLGTTWGLKFKRVYLDAWPADPKFSSVFMRMTASDAKPFYALKFIKDNQLEGKMFNYWTEGGFIAWGQQPGEKGKTPLQLFMDGRAQAAYNRDAFDLWSHIMAGGIPTYQIMERSVARGQQITAEEYGQIGQWMDEQLRAYNVWVVLMPSTVFDDPDRQAKYYAIKGLERNPYWRLIFHNRRQRLYVDIRTPRGKELFDGIFDGSTIYPDDYHTNLIRAHTCLLYRLERAEKRRGLDFAMKAFDLMPSSTPMTEILVFGENFSELSADVNRFCQEYFDRYIENQDQWAKQDGHRERVDAARIACFHLKRLAQTQKDTELARFYAAKEDECVDELIRMAQSQRW